LTEAHYDIKIRKINHISASLSFINAQDVPIATPAGAELKIMPTEELVPAFANIYVVFWAESYTLYITGVPVFKLNNQRQQAISKAGTVTITKLVRQIVPQLPVIAPIIPPPVHPNAVNVMEEDDGMDED
jgi:hypothetical protein